MQLHQYPTPGQLVEALANFMVDGLKQVLQAKERASVVLSGGSSPKQLYTLLASDYAQALDWQKLDFFFGDERYVPSDDAAYNGRMARLSLFEPLAISPSNIHYVNTSLSVNEAATDYQRRIKAYFNGDTIAFDFNLLGLGDNAHTASLFPHTTVLSSAESAVLPVYVEELQSWRITMSAPMINDSKQVVFLVYGEGKAEAVQQVIQASRNIEQYPAQLIAPVAGELHWFVDDAAAALLG